MELMSMGRRLAMGAAIVLCGNLLVTESASACDKCRAAHRQGCARCGGNCRGGNCGVGAHLRGAMMNHPDSGYAQAAPRNGLFYNYYVDGAGSVPAQLYLSPRPTPPLVGHTYITYEPLMPHEFLYRHHKTYYRMNGLFPANKTTVWWW